LAFHPRNNEKRNCTFEKWCKGRTESGQTQKKGVGQRGMPESVVIKKGQGEWGGKLYLGGLKKTEILNKRLGLGGGNGDTKNHRTNDVGVFLIAGGQSDKGRPNDRFVSTFDGGGEAE